MDNNWERDPNYQVDLTTNNGFPVYSRPTNQYTANQTSGAYTPNPMQPVSGGKKKRYGAGVIAICAVLSLVCGFGGAYLGTRVFAPAQVTAAAPANDAGLTDASAHTAPAVSTQIESMSAVVDATKDSVVEINTESMATSSFFGQYITQGAGSGVIIREDGYIVTNSHVVSTANNVTVILNDGTKYEATVVGTDATSDLAVIKVDATGLTPAVLGSSADVKVGDEVIAIGNPLGSLGGTVTDGIVSALDREILVSGQSMTLLQTSAAINPGNSGGGLFNAYGELIGIVNAKPSSRAADGSGIDGLGFAIPVDTVRTVCEDLINNGYVSGRPQLGITVMPITDAQTASQYGVSRYGVYIIEVKPNSGAAQAGLEVGDLIMSVNDTAVSASTDVTFVLSKCEVGDVVTVQVARGSKVLSFDVTLSEVVPETAAPETVDEAA